MNSRTFEIEMEYYNCGQKLYTIDKFTFKPNVTVLVGCNGCGKTTLIHQMKHELECRKIPYLSFNNLIDGGANAMNCALDRSDIVFLATAATSSEGENIVLNIGRMAAEIGKQLRSADKPEEYWIFMDAIDSGMSIDNIVDIKQNLFDVIIRDNPNTTVYIVVSANEYELASGEQCFDVHNGRYITFDNYDSYRDFILESRAQKNKRHK